MDETTYVAPRHGDDADDRLDAHRQARLIAEYGFRGAAFFLHGTRDLAA